MKEEFGRAPHDGLTEAELAIFDLLTKPALALTDAKTAEVKRVAREVTERLQCLVGATGWPLSHQARAAVLSEIRVKLNELPEEPFPEDLWRRKGDQVWEFVLRRYSKPRRDQNYA